jgi:hypothetical protein
VNIKRAAATLAAALIVTGSPVLASAAQAQMGPIRIDNVQLFGIAVNDDVNMNVPAIAQIAFTNEYDVPATEIVFVVERNGYVIDRFQENGIFAKGITVNERFPETNGGAGERVAVERASFADGTVWTNDAVATPPQAPAPIGVGIDARF